MPEREGWKSMLEFFFEQWQKIMQYARQMCSHKKRTFRPWDEFSGRDVLHDRFSDDDCDFTHLDRFHPEYDCWNCLCFSRTERSWTNDAWFVILIIVVVIVIVVVLRLWHDIAWTRNDQRAKRNCLVAAREKRTRREGWSLCGGGNEEAVFAQAPEYVHAF